MKQRMEKKEEGKHGEMKVTMQNRKRSSRLCNVGREEKRERKIRERC